MEEPFEPHNVAPELYFLIAKFLSGGPLKETAQTLLKELETVEVLPRRLDWEGDQHAQSYDELSATYAEMPWQRLANVCSRALRLAEQEHSPRLAARLSLLSETLVATKPLHEFFKEEHSLVRRLVRRELGLRPPGGYVGGGGLSGGRSLFPPRMLSGLQLQRRTLGHLSAVYCLVFEPSGRYVITGADDLLVKVWSAVDGRLVGTLRGAGAEITDASVSSDGALLACGSVERLVRVWTLDTQAPRAVLSAHSGTITSVAWAPPARADVRWLASTSTDGSVAFWTCSPDGQFLSQPVQYVERMRPGACHMICAAWSPGGAFLCAGSADAHVRLYDVTREPHAPRRILETAVHSDAVDSIAWAHRGLRFVSGSKDGTAAIWTLHATQWRHSLLLPTGQPKDGKRLKVTMVCWDCSDAYVITAVSDCTIRVWCSLTCAQLSTLSGHRDEAYVLEPHPFLSGVLLSAGHDGQLLVWRAPDANPLASFHNHIPGQGDGAIFDAKWSASGSGLAASDSHGHLLLLGLGRGHSLLHSLPAELFYHTDYRPLVRDALGGALDEQTQTPPHLMPPPFLVDVEGAPHPPALQRLVPGRENLALSQLIPRAPPPPPAAASLRLDRMIQALAGEREPPGENGWGGLEARGIWRNEGVRHTEGSWQRGEPLQPARSRPMVPPLAAKHREQIEDTSAELNAMEQAWYRREMRRRPVMISTAPGDVTPSRRRARAPRRHTTIARMDEPPESEPCSDSSDSSVRLSASARSDHSTHSSHSSLDLTEPSSSSSSQYSDWEAGGGAPPARARRRPQRYTPPRAPRPRPQPQAPPDQPAHRLLASTASGSGASPPPGAEAGAGGEAEAEAGEELPEAFRPGEWVTSVAPRKAPYHPQMGDHCLYFRVGHQRYFEAVAEKDLYKINPRDKPWERTHVNECELVKVVGIKYVIKPPRVACVRLACVGGEGEGEGRARSLTVRYHDMADVIDFLVLKQQYDAATSRQWTMGDRFRCMIDDSWWTGIVLERVSPPPAPPSAPPATPPPPPPQPAWSAEAASHFLSLKVQWDNGEVERLSPWDLEPIDPERLPRSCGGAVPVLPHELEAVLYKPEPAEWPPRGDRASACRAIAQHISQVMTLSVAEPFLAPVDLQLYPTYARVVPYPVDLATIRARFENLFYRRVAAAQFDVRYLASNAERFNEPRAVIVRQARLLCDLLLHIISRWRDADVMSKYHELSAAYRSSDDEPLASHPQRKSGATRRGATRRGVTRRGAAAGWVSACEGILMELMSSSDAEPFRSPVSADQAPDYHMVVSEPMDLGTVAQRLARRLYPDKERFCADIRAVFSNSRLYNTNKRSRIYSMTVRLSALFEALCVERFSRTDRRPERDRPRRSHRPRRQRNVKGMNGNGNAESSESESESEPLAATSRRVHGLRARAPRPRPRPRGPRGGSRGPRGGARADSWDSDVPLHKHSKGKGIGKKSKSSSASAEPIPSTSAAPPRAPTPPGAAGGGSEGGSSACTNFEVLEEELLDDVHLTYTDNSDGTSQLQEEEEEMCCRKRARLSSSGSRGYSSRARTKRRRTRHKRMRERFEDVSSSSSSSAGEVGGAVGGGSEGGRYESDRSYHPRDSSDDDAPLHLYRQRGPGDDEAGPSTYTSHNGHSRRSESLRAQRARRYHDSSSDSASAISKRARPPPRPPTRPPTRPPPRSADGATADHTYYNGNAHSSASSRALSPAQPQPGAAASASAVSVSSRGRVRTLTAKARGLLRD